MSFHSGDLLNLLLMFESICLCGIAGIDRSIFSTCLQFSGIIGLCVGFVSLSNCIRTTKMGKILYGGMMVGLLILGCICLVLEIGYLYYHYTLSHCFMSIPPTQVTMMKYECDCICHRKGFDQACESRGTFCLKQEMLRSVLSVVLVILFILNLGQCITGAYCCSLWYRKLRTLS